MADPIRAVKGMNDLLPPDSARWQWFEDTVRALMRRYAYQFVRTPIVEHTPLFVRGLGEVTDIVEKEMYSFVDSMNGDPLTLRPEGTAGVVRAMVEHNALYDGGKRLFYIGPMFRHERPQRGRYRQFHQVGVEALGYAGPEVDAEVILMCRALWQDLGLGEVRLDINSLGQPDERRAHRAALIAHFEAHRDQLDADAQRRLHSNPLRILDTKNPAMQPLVEAAPQLMSYLGEASLKHFDALKAMLDAAGQPFRVNPRLVRGMDYYNLTVFEWVTDKLGAQGTICGGGRYDGLMELVGGKPAPGIGWGMGIERVLDLVQQIGSAPPAPVPDAYAIVPDAAAMPVAVRTVEVLRAAGLAVQLHAGGGSMKTQFKKADASGARHALIFGGDELARAEVAVKPLRDATAAQVSQPLADPAAWAASLRNA
ncbi:histidine--tRNA ligase [Rubrivivax albus]|uniref:Histidine--tRNA ligase n=1 Tax=Rubrivivax albus TaxID=2499835 RepID=A0A437K1K5_9BURK|nr:histidine--tRNA ligase [Rubrivivax albus]RVT54174.1 histidine--tRNA ligase [Rubrivivax albus]